MPKYSDLIHALRDCSDQSTHELKILSSLLRESADILDRFNIRYEDEAEGISIDLTAQPMKIFKSKASAVAHLSESDFSSDIIVTEADGNNSECNDIEYLADTEPHSGSYVFDNIQYSHKFKSLFLDKEIASYNDETRNRLIFLSNKHGRLHISFGGGWSPEFHDHNHELKSHYQRLEERISTNKDFEDFFKESLLEFAKGVSEEGKRFLEILKSMKYIIESSERNFELYKHNFSFAEFKKELDEDKEKYLKDYQSNLSDFLSKIASMPIQFGVYIYLMVRFSEELLPIVATMILITVWSVFKVLTVNRILENVDYLKSKFESDLDSLVIRSGIDTTEVEATRTLVDKRFDKSLFLIKAYRLFVVIFSICAFAICLQFVLTLLNHVGA